MESRKTVLKNLFTGQQWRNRHREQTYGHGERGRKVGKQDIPQMLFFLIFFCMKDNCFTELCCFLSNLNMNQPWVYIYPLPFEARCHLSPHPTPQVDTEPLFELPEPQSKFLWAIYFTFGNVKFPCYSFRTSHFLLPSPHVHKSILYVCFSIAAL